VRGNSDIWTYRAPQPGDECPYCEAKLFQVTERPVMKLLEPRSRLVCEDADCDFTMRYEASRVALRE
jgi:hypothetical protein